MRAAAAVALWVLGALIVLVGCGGGSAPKPARAAAARSSASRRRAGGRPPAPFIDPHNIYAADRAGEPCARGGVDRGDLAG